MCVCVCVPPYVCIYMCVCVRERERKHVCPCVSRRVELNGTFQSRGETMWSALTALEGGRRAQLVPGEELCD